MTVRILASDCGLAHYGVAVLAADPTTVKCLHMGVIVTKKSDAKRRVLAADDTTRRVRELVAVLVRLLDVHKPHVLAVEAMSFPRHASAAVKLGMARATLDTLAEVRGLPVLSASPQEVKLALCGNKSASKADVEAAVLTRLSDATFFGPKSNREHAYDAAAVGLTCLQSDIVRALRRAA